MFALKSGEVENETVSDQVGKIIFLTGHSDHHFLDAGAIGNVESWFAFGAD